jgi:hypothetical protein
VPREKLRKARKYVKSRNLDKGQTLDPADREWLKTRLHDDVQRLGRYLNTDLFAEWKW